MGSGQKQTGNRRVFPPRGVLCLAAALAFLALLFISCGERGGVPGQIKLPPEVAAKFGTLTVDSIQPFDKTDIDKIKVNYLHQQHSIAGLKCVTCHETTEKFTLKQQLKLCQDCHNQKDQPQFFIARDLWNNHCFACHRFTGDRISEQNFVPDIETCKTCHEYKDAGPYIFGFYSNAMKRQMSCRTCHKPHANPPVFATDNCSSCHGEFGGNVLMKGGHKSCTLCHTPHWWKAPEDLDCTQCHDAPQSVMAHRLKFHPKKCLACHSPHFQDTKIKGGKCQACHDNFKLKFAENLPAAHMECTNCHSGDNFVFKGVDNTCYNCHKDKAKSVSQDFVPAKHQQCTSCHQPHTWAASFNTCKQCHDITKVVEHNVPGHPKDCKQCHDPHFSFETPKSGQCNDCHGAGTIPSFNPSLPPQHVACSSCHTPDSNFENGFTFAGEDDTCKVCHAQAPDDGGTDWSDVPAGHTMCTACHKPHTWSPQFGEDSCGICHPTETEAVADNLLHSDCRSCHVPGHKMTFAGKENSCDICHADVLEQGKKLGKEDCFLCHTQHTFKVDDANTCTICHTEAPDSGKDWSEVPAGHTTCSGCHRPHDWQPQTDGATCAKCHTKVAQATKGNDMHSECINCHTPGHDMTFAGPENSCDLCHTEIADQVAKLGKDDCTMCHTQHTFKPDTTVCTVCHTDLFATHNTPGHAECLNCHKMHTFEADRSVCTTCHTDRQNHHPEIKDCVRCHIFRRGG